MRTECITDLSNLEGLKAFHDLLRKEFKNTEVEPIEVFEQELSTGNFILGLVYESAELLSGAYGSVFNLDEKSSALAIRFTFTEIKARGTGVSQVADKLLIEKSADISSHKKRSLRCLICEGVEKSEHYWNTIGINDDQGMKRVYGELSSNVLEEIQYIMPPVEWNKDGSPRGNGEKEHLMVLWKESPNEIRTSDLILILKAWWNQWYKRGIEHFDSETSRRKHTEFVDSFLMEKVISPLRNYSKFYLLSREERETWKTAGYSIQDIKL